MLLDTRSAVRLKALGILVPGYRHDIPVGDALH